MRHCSCGMAHVSTVFGCIRSLLCIDSVARNPHHHPDRWLAVPRVTSTPYPPTPYFPPANQPGSRVGSAEFNLRPSPRDQSSPQLEKKGEMQICGASYHSADDKNYLFRQLLNYGSGWLSITSVHRPYPTVRVANRGVCGTIEAPIGIWPASIARQTFIPWTIV